MALVDNLIASLTKPLPDQKRPLKVIKLRERHIDFGLGKHGVLKRVKAQRFAKHKYTHIQLNGVVKKVTVSKGLFNCFIVWIE